MTIQDALVAYRTYAKAEGKSPKTISWVVSSVSYFADFLGPKQQDIAVISVGTKSLLQRQAVVRWFVVAKIWEKSVRVLLR